MSTKKVLLVVLIASAVVLAVGVGPRFANTARALPAAQEPDPTGVTIPYPGRLSDEGGQSVADGAYDFTFALYDAETGGEPLWSEVQEGVPVEGGAFAVMLGDAEPIPAALLTGGERWLAVGVRGPGEAEFTALTPRQRLSAASLASPASPAAPALTGTTCAHTHEGEMWSATGGTKGLYLSTAGGYGLEAWSSGNIGVLGISTSAAVFMPSGMHGLYGIGDGYGIVAQGTSGAGWFGGYNDNNDIFLGGATGRINTDPDNENSQLYLSSNADVIVKLDNDGGENHTFHIWDSTGNDLCTVSENGYAGFFTGTSDDEDLALGGATGRINTDPNDLESDLYLSSNGDVTIKLDNDSGGGGANVLYIRSRGHEIARMDDTGNLTIQG
ncbi:MAG: hypothetical protein ISS49_17510, partial [Anaerolineae bacterium]|nr:hypothetical protein [Anaerolineae bacterium]